MLLEMLARMLHMSPWGENWVFQVSALASLRSDEVARLIGLFSFHISYVKLDQVDRYSYHAALNTT